MSALRSLVVWLVLSTQVWTPALAQTLPISVDKSVAGQRPVVGVSRGVPVVDIAPPSAGGVSNNRFTQFNVGPSGVVLNNSGAGRQTQLAGPVAGNPMLGDRHAGIILNQVTAPNPSQLAGMLEVAGHRASVIVANPAGISCDGCGFLNANRATLTTGKPVIGADGALGFDVTEGRLAIEGAGLYGANLGRLDLLARALEINAEVWADRLDVTAGAAHVDYASGAVAARTGDGPAPVVSLDTAALGGMYANSIRLIGTEAGVGVNIGGNLAALTGGLSVDVNGDVRIQPSGRLQAAADLSLRGAGDIVNDGALAAAGPLALRAANTVANNGAISSGASAAIVAGRFDNGGVVTTGMQADGALDAAGALDVRAGRVRNAGTLAASGNAAIRGNTLDLSGGKLVAGAELALDAGGALANRGGALYGGSVTLRAGSLDNRGGKLASGATLSGRVMGALDNTGGTVAGAGLVDLGAGSIVNAAGGVASAQDVRLHGDAGIDNRGGTIQAGGAARVDTGGAFDNRGGKLLGDALALEAAGVDNRDGVLRAEGQLALDAAGALRNQGGRLYGGSPTSAPPASTTPAARSWAANSR
ncbi:filamentous hemagglutinin N-terminal domain-containing protein [Achromobacter xylosoxidans]